MGLLEARQAELNMTAVAYRTTGGSRNYLHIGVPPSVLTIGQQIKMSLYVGNSPGAKDQDFTYLVRLLMCVSLYVPVREIILYVGSSPGAKDQDFTYLVRLFMCVCLYVPVRENGVSHFIHFFQVMPLLPCHLPPQ